MKKIFILSLCLGFATLAFSQQKPEFGFLVKAGNYAIPTENTGIVTHYLYNANGTTLIHKPGYLYSIGIWQSWPLGKHFRLSGELVYRAGSIRSEQRYSDSFFDGASIININNREIQKINENSIHLPIKLHFSFKKEGKTALFLGAGISRVIAGHIFQENQFNTSGFTASSFTSDVGFNNWRNFNNQFSLIAGLNYSLSPNTSFGIEYTFEKSSIFYSSAQNILFKTFEDCFCTFLSDSFRPNMNSFSVSLRHNILD